MYFLLRNSKSQGPYSVADLLWRLHRKEIDETALIHEGAPRDEWAPCQTLSTLLSRYTPQELDAIRRQSGLAFGTPSPMAKPLEPQGHSRPWPRDFKCTIVRNSKSEGPYALVDLLRMLSDKHIDEATQLIPEDMRASSQTLGALLKSIPTSELEAVRRQVAAPQAARFCEHCGRPVSPEANFCMSCGTKLPGTVRATLAPAQLSSSPPQSSVAPSANGVPGGDSFPLYQPVIWDIPWPVFAVSALVLCGGYLLLVDRNFHLSLESGLAATFGHSLASLLLLPIGAVLGSPIWLVVRHVKRPHRVAFKPFLLAGVLFFILVGLAARSSAP